MAPASMYLVGLIRKDEKSKKTALLAGEAVVDAELVTSVMKDIDRRLRPAAIALTAIIPTPGLRAAATSCAAKAVSPPATPSPRPPSPPWWPAATGASTAGFPTSLTA